MYKSKNPRKGKKPIIIDRLCACDTSMKGHLMLSPLNQIQHTQTMISHAQVAMIAKLGRTHLFIPMVALVNG